MESTCHISDFINSQIVHFLIFIQYSLTKSSEGVHRYTMQIQYHLWDCSEIQFFYHYLRCWMLIDAPKWKDTTYGQIYLLEGYQVDLYLSVSTFLAIEMSDDIHCLFPLC